MRVVVAHPQKQYVYQTVLAAQERGCLQAFATSVYIDPSSLVARGVSMLAARFGARGVIRSGLGRSHPEIDTGKVVTFPWWAAAARLTWALPFGSIVETQAARRTDMSIARWLYQLDPKPQLVHGFDGGARSTFAAARKRGIATVLDVSIAHEYVRRELLREAGEKAIAGLDTARIRAEREAADVLVAPSEWVRRCLLENGVDAKKIVQIPFGADPHRVTRCEDRDDVFRVLFVGGVGLRKGVRYLLEAWRRLALPKGELVLLGGVDRWGRRLREQHHEIARFEGQVTGSEVDRWFSVSDVFAFPSLAEGSALVTYEALAAGLPVVTTPNAGSVVSDGVDGFIVLPRDVDALANRLQFLYENRGAMRRMGERGRDKIRTCYTWSHYRTRLAALYEEVCDAGSKPL